MHLSRSLLPGLVPLAAVVVLACGGAASRPAPPVASPDEAAVRAARAAQNDAIARRDLDRVASFWTDDVSITAGLGSILRGRDAYRQAFERDASLTYRREPRTVAVSESWPIAWEEGTWTATRAGGATSLIGGRYSAQWLRGPDGWRIRSELFVALDCSGEACGWPVAGR